MYNVWDRLNIHWINYKIIRNSAWCFLNDMDSFHNDGIFNKLWIKDKYEFCWVHVRSGSFPEHETIEQLNITIQKLLNYWKYENDFYINMMKHE